MKDAFEAIGIILLAGVLIVLTFAISAIVIAAPFALIGGLFWFICWTIKTLFL